MHLLNNRIKNINDCQFFFDFDNTITLFDVLDDLIKRFSINKDWVALEKSWKEGKIGSGECLRGQLRGVRISREGLLKYLSGVKIDPYFLKLLKLFKQCGIKPVILSDDFSLIIKRVLKNNGITGLKVYSNRLHFNQDKLITRFPYSNKSCNTCGHCKKNNLINNYLKDKIIVYIGDGFSDVCPAKSADIVFAKGSLLRHFRKEKKPCLAIRELKDVYDYLIGAKS